MSEGKLRTYVCKRARMADYLMEKGFVPYKVTPDRDNPIYDVFLFTGTPELYKAVAEYISTSRERSDDSGKILQMPMKIYILIREEDTDAACGSTVMPFLNREDAQTAMREDWEAEAKVWKYADHEHYDEDACSCEEEAGVAVIREGFDVESWRIEEHDLDVRIAVDDERKENRSGNYL